MLVCFSFQTLRCSKAWRRHYNIGTTHLINLRYIHTESSIAYQPTVARVPVEYVQCKGERVKAYQMTEVKVKVTLKTEWMTRHFTMEPVTINQIQIQMMTNGVLQVFMSASPIYKKLNVNVRVSQSRERSYRQYVASIWRSQGSVSMILRR